MNIWSGHNHNIFIKATEVRASDENMLTDITGDMEIPGRREYDALCSEREHMLQLSSHSARSVDAALTRQIHIVFLSLLTSSFVYFIPVFLIVTYYNDQAVILIREIQYR
jgi:hypothetical protein